MIILALLRMIAKVESRLLGHILEVINVPLAGDCASTEVIVQLHCSELD